MIKEIDYYTIASILFQMKFPYVQRRYQDLTEIEKREWIRQAKDLQKELGLFGLKIDYEEGVRF
jgi:hypothetical protein